MTATRRKPATLALEDGTVFHGYAIGAEGMTSGEVVFNTSMTGYQEILTDPSYAFQLLTFTCPHIGNVGVNAEDVESKRVQAAGIIVRELSECYSNYRATQSLNEYLESQGIVGIGGIDTRALVLHLRDHGSKMGVIASGKYAEDALVDKAKALPSMEGLDLVKRVSAEYAYDWDEGTWKHGIGFSKVAAKDLSERPLVCALDFGIKYNILRLLTEVGFRVKVLPGTSTAAEVQTYSPDAVFLSNGPGDPAAVTYAIETTRALVGKVPMFGICLGHQILGHALGAPTYKLKFGHRGGNHPVRNQTTGFVEITVQNHGFATHADSVPKEVEITHINLNDNTVEGLRVPDAKCFSVQYHPESSPGPSDARYLFEEFISLVKGN